MKELYYELYTADGRGVTPAYIMSIAPTEEVAHKNAMDMIGKMCANWMMGGLRENDQHNIDPQITVIDKEKYGECERKEYERFIIREDRDDIVHMDPMEEEGFSEIFPKSRGIMSTSLYTDGETGELYLVESVGDEDPEEKLIKHLKEEDPDRKDIEDDLNHDMVLRDSATGIYAITT